MRGGVGGRIESEWSVRLLVLGKNGRVKVTERGRRLREVMIADLGLGSGIGRPRLRLGAGSEGDGKGYGGGEAATGLVGTTCCGHIYHIYYRMYINAL